MNNGFPWMGSPIPGLQPNFNPPNVHDGYDAYIKGILDQGGMMGDSVRIASMTGQPPKKSTLDKIVKWTGVAFAGVLALIGLQKFGPKLLGAFKK
jgi:hypothetical protein